MDRYKITHKNKIRMVKEINDPSSGLPKIPEGACLDIITIIHRADSTKIIANFLNYLFEFVLDEEQTKNNKWYSFGVPLEII